jgi:hypothetical protein
MLIERIVLSPAAGTVARMVLVATVLAFTFPAITSGQEETEPSGAMRRLTEAQYHNASGDIFGKDIEFAGRMDPLVRPSRGLEVAGVSQILESEGSK